MEFSGAALQKVREDRLLIDKVDQWLYEIIKPDIGRRVLEIGCGMGNFARHLTNLELYIGTDISASSVTYLTETYGQADKMLAFEVDAASPEFLALSRYRVDTIFSLNVFEHIEDDRQALANAVEVLQPGGNLILVVPAHGWLYGSIDRAIGHYRRYNKRQLADLFQSTGLQPLRQQYINFLGAMGWLVNGRIRSQETPPSGQLRYFNKLVPALKRFEDVVPVPFGISLLSVGYKE